MTEICILKVSTKAYYFLRHNSNQSIYFIDKLHWSNNGHDVNSYVNCQMKNIYFKTKTIAH